ncbi:MAG: SMI1/KNR4 family protein [Chloroflexota bacterium]|nr:SMI1/KNR4 family protein [Chloroflexota bacterium]
MDYLKEIRQFYTKHIEPYLGKPVGCSPAEIEIMELEQRVRFPLPAAYTQYLAWMGNDFDGIFRGSDWFISNVIERSAALPDLLQENHIAYALPEHYLVFCAHQGYVMAWFALPMEHDNPPAYFYSEGQNLRAPYLAGTFTDVVFDDMRGLATLLPQIYR